jgi:hypothetical protein
LDYLRVVAHQHILEIHVVDYDKEDLETEVLAMWGWLLRLAKRVLEHDISESVMAYWPSCAPTEQGLPLPHKDEHMAPIVAAPVRHALDEIKKVEGEAAMKAHIVAMWQEEVRAGRWSLTHGIDLKDDAKVGVCNNLVTTWARKSACAQWYRREAALDEKVGELTEDGSSSSSHAPPLSLGAAARTAVGAPPAAPQGEFTLSAAALAAVERAVQPSQQPPLPPPAAAPAAVRLPIAGGSTSAAPSSEALEQPPAAPAAVRPPIVGGSTSAPPSSEALEQMVAKAGKLVRGVSEEQIRAALRAASYNFLGAVLALKEGGVASAPPLLPHLGRG